MKGRAYVAIRCGVTLKQGRRTTEYWLWIGVDGGIVDTWAGLAELGVGHAVQQADEQRQQRAHRVLDHPRGRMDDGLQGKSALSLP